MPSENEQMALATGEIRSEKLEIRSEKFEKRSETDEMCSEKWEIG